MGVWNGYEGNEGEICANDRKVYGVRDIGNDSGIEDLELSKSAVEKLIGWALANCHSGNAMSACILEIFLYSPWVEWP